MLGKFVTSELNMRNPVQTHPSQTYSKIINMRRLVDGVGSTEVDREYALKFQTATR